MQDLNMIDKMRVIVLLMAASTCLGAATSRAADEDRYSIPEGLLIGAAVSAVQTEGAAYTDGKGESRMDYLIGHAPAGAFPADHFTAADSYHRYEYDVDMAAKLKLKLYKFSISWPRILPDGDPKNVNKKGVEFYHRLIAKIKEKGMTPMAMLYHFDHPQALHAQDGGWNGHGIVDKFVEYAKVVHEEYGKDVEYWITVNEPNMYCAYFNTLPPGSDQNKVVYDCFYNSIMGHKKAYHAIKQNSKYKSMVGYSAHLIPARAATTRPEDAYAAEVYNQVHVGTVMNPLVFGDYPQVVKKVVGSKLTQFTPEDKQGLMDSIDFVGLNLYFGMTASYNRFNNATGSAGVAGLAVNPLMADMKFIDLQPMVEPGKDFTVILPDVMRTGLLWAHQTFNKPIVICENGFGDTLGLGINDNDRAAYHSAFLRALVTTMKDYAVKVLAYSAWSLIDSWEFTSGFDRPFGLVHVDYASGSLNRSLKESSSFWIEMADTGRVPLVLPTPTSAPPTANPAPKPTGHPPKPTGNPPKPTGNPPKPTGNPPKPTGNPPKPTAPTTDKPSAASTHVASVLLALVAACTLWR